MAEALVFVVRGHISDRFVKANVVVLETYPFKLDGENGGDRKSVV